MCIVHTETSTGAVTDLAAMRAAIDSADHPALFVVDAVCSLGIEPLRMRDWGIDVAVAASQKGLMMPPGLSICAVSRRALERNRSAATPRFHLAWGPRFQDGPIYNRFGGTPPIQHMYAFRTALDMIAETGGIDASVAPPPPLGRRGTRRSRGVGVGRPVGDQHRRAQAPDCGHHLRAHR